MSIPHTPPQEVSNDHIDFDVIAALLLEDVGKLQANRKDKRREDAPMADDELALHLFADELRSALSVIQDERLARSVAAALSTDHAVIEEFQQSDARVLEDRSIAIRMEQGEDVSRPPSVSPRTIAAEETLVPSLSAGSSQDVISSRGAIDDADYTTGVPGPVSPPDRRYVLIRH